MKPSINTLYRCFITLFTITHPGFLLNGSASGTLPGSSNPKSNSFISGKIIDKSTGRPVEYATMVLYRSSDSSMVTGAVSDSGGNFRISGVPKGEYFLASSFIGYNKKIVKDIKVSTERQELRIGTVYLEEAKNNLKEVNVVATQNMVTTKIDKMVVSAKQQLNAQGGTAVDLLRNLSSVNVDADGNVSIRGSSNFRLLIDGRPAPVQGSGGLQQITAGSVENIEIITNPSAKYDPDGTAGIVNVMMKKEKNKGISGGINLSAGLNEKFAGDALINIRKQNLNYFVGVDFQSRFTHPYSMYKRENYFNDTTMYTDYETFRSGRPLNRVLRAGIDYSISPKNTFSVSADYNRTKYNRRFSTHVKKEYVPGEYTNYDLIQDDYHLWGDYLNTNLGYTHSFPQKGHAISTNLTYSLVKNRTDEVMNTYSTNSSFKPMSNSIDDESFVHNKRNYLQFKADYTKPFKGDYTLEAGYQSDLTFKTTDFLYTGYDTVSRQWVTDSAMSNNIAFIQNIQSIYLTFGGVLWGISYQLGLRAEYYSRNLQQKTTNIDYIMEMINFFPSVRLTRSLPSNQEITLAYSRRVNRPEDRQLNPFAYFSDPYTLQTGNPYLNPEFIDSYELNYEKKFKWGNLTAGSYYRQVHNEISTVIVSMPDHRLNLYPENMGTGTTIGLDLGGNISLFKCWKLVPGISLSNYTQNATLDEFSYHTNNNLVNLRVTTTFIITENTRLQVSPGYNSPSHLIEGDFRSMYFVNASVRQDFLQKKLSLTLNVNDIFSSNYYYFDDVKPAFRVYGAYYPEAPVVLLTLSYKFNDFNPRQKSQGPSNIETGL